MKTFLTFLDENDALNPQFPYGGSNIGPGLDQFIPVADLNAQSQKEIKKSDLDQVEKYADRLFASLGIDVEFTRHFLDRVNDSRNVKQITPAELTRLFKQSYKKYGKKIAKLGPDAEAVINDMKTDINMPFVLNLKGGELELIAKTVMRKKNFKTSGPKMSFEQFDEEPRIPRKKGQPAGSKKHSDLYTDENPKGTIHGLGFKDVATAKASVKKIEGSGKTHAHKIQAAIAMEQRARVMGKTAEANVYRAYIEKMKKITKKKQTKESVYDTKCPPGYKYDKKLRSCVPKKGILYPYPFAYFGRSKSSSNQNGQNGNGQQSANGNGQQSGNGNGQTGNGNGGNSGNGGNGQ